MLLKRCDYYVNSTELDEDSDSSESSDESVSSTATSKSVAFLRGQVESAISDQEKSKVILLLKSFRSIGFLPLLIHCKTH